MLKVFKHIKTANKILRDPYNETINRATRFCKFINDRISSIEDKDPFYKILLEEEIYDEQLKFVEENILRNTPIEISRYIIAVNWFVYSNTMGVVGTTRIPYEEKTFHNQYVRPIMVFLKGNRNIYLNIKEHTSVLKELKEYFGDVDGLS